MLGNHRIWIKSYSSQDRQGVLIYRIHAYEIVCPKLDSIIIHLHLHLDHQINLLKVCDSATTLGTYSYSLNAITIISTTVYSEIT